jgi:hypothetical protein
MDGFSEAPHLSAVAEPHRLAAQEAAVGCRSGEMDIAYQSAGLKIWASWANVNHVVDVPLLKGAATIAMAREVFGIRYPSDSQLALF